MLPIVAPQATKTKFPIWVIRDTEEGTSLGNEMANGIVRRFGAKEHVFLPGDRRSHLYQVEDGLVALCKLAPNGQRQIIRFCFPGDLIGLGSQKEHTLSAQTLQPSQLRCVPLTVLTRKAELHPPLAAELCEALSNELAMLQDHLLTVGQRSALERVANFLVNLSRHNVRVGGNPKVFALPMTREDIGDFLGLTLETVSRTLTKLRLAGLAHFKQGHKITLLDIEKLEELADVR